ncbi:golgin subfamily A member 2-like [Musca domestica]|uniref:Golgin subfamily A member 2-like n=1 Tax=Musca domestica TaxID=7370 RepID=T1PGF4_MUSDO|nr:golgin subfamily A member 2-like [Musca domestica]
MPEESKESKAKKLAAARKKLREYQQRGNAEPIPQNVESVSNSGHVSSNISERSESDLHLNGTNLELDVSQICKAQNDDVSSKTELESVNYFANTPQEDTSKSFPISLPSSHIDEPTSADGTQNINAIQVLISEKAQLTSELNRYRTTCREKDLELEELRVQYGNVTRRVDDLQEHLKDTQKQLEQHRMQNAELQHKLAQTRALNEDQSSHLLELQQQMQLREERLKALDNEHKEKCNELELAQLKIRQLSDESNITKDNRVETLTQTQFMYEQQIRDLQAMVQQLTQDKEQANTQYQTYVQQLNAQVNQLNERNSELMEESSKLREREKQMVDHVQQLEREIQKNISRQSEIKEVKSMSSSEEVTNNQQLQELRDRIQEYETERYEFQLKIKSQEDRLITLQNEYEQKKQDVEELREQLENVTAEQPDKTKLLAAMESDKIAASRALSQNVELKKQMDELELRFVQLTNDKADLMNRLDSEQFSNREMRSNYSAMEQRLQELDERFKFKDEEMIRLSHENEELKKKLGLSEETGRRSRAANDHEHYHEDGQHEHDHNHEHHHEDHHHHNEHHHEAHHHHHEHHHDQNGHDHCHHDQEQQNCNDGGSEVHDEHDSHKHSHDNDNENECNSQMDVCEEATEIVQRPVTPKMSTASKPKTPHIATEEAVEKLQLRFTQLMGQVADLTEEKQRLEHLVMQLQSETETIGEYIALYQTQRRILKQREYEKAAQTALLQEERQQMRERLTMLNNLVNSLGMEIPLTQQQHQLHQQLNEALAESATQDGHVEKDCPPEDPLLTPANSITETTNDNCKSSPEPHIKNLNSLESQQILHKIQDIITEIKENTKELPSVQHSVDHLNCCSGKFEVV